MKRSRHSQTTLPNTLGELEFSVMAVVWQATSTDEGLGGVDAKRILEVISAEQPSTLSTIQSTLERLVRKGMLERRKQGHAFYYTALVSRSALLGLLMKDVIGLLHDGRPDTILSSFVNVASRISSAALDQLEQLIRHKRRQLETQAEDRLDEQFAARSDKPSGTRSMGQEDLTDDD
jgi:predicted transcriptional regulator